MPHNIRVEIRLRPFKKADLEALWSLDQLCFSPQIAYSRQELTAYISRPRASTIVAEAAPIAGRSTENCNTNGTWHLPDGIAGFVIAEGTRSAVGHIITLDVLPIARRSGLGTRLLSAAESALMEAGNRTVRLETERGNTAAQTFYRANGYELVGTIPEYYGTGADAFSFTKTLTDRRFEKPKSRRISIR